MLARALVSEATAERRAGAVSMEETGFAQHTPARLWRAHARSFAQHAPACAMMQCGATCTACMRAWVRTLCALCEHVVPSLRRNAIGPYRFVQFTLQFLGVVPQ